MTWKKATAMVYALVCLLGLCACTTSSTLEKENPQQQVQTEDTSGEVREESTSASSSKNTISSAEYSYSPAMKFLDDDELLCSLGLQTFQLDCPTASSNDTVFVQLQLPEQWTQDDDTPTLFYFPDGSKAMQLEILPLEQGQCIWSAERLWEDKSCISYSEKYIHYSWYIFQRYTFYSIHALDEQNLYDYTYYLPYGSAYFAVHFYTYGESNENALRFQKGFLEMIQLLTPIPEQVFSPLSGETWKATVSLTAEEQTIEITLDVPVEWAQQKPGSSVFHDSNSVRCISSMSLIKLSPGKTVWDIADEDEMLQRTAVVNGQEIPRLVFTPPYKPGEDSSEEFGSRRYYYYLPIEENCLLVPLFAKGIDNEQYIQLHQAILESIAIQ